MSAFYVTLPSNSSLQYYPKNTTTNFVTRLPNNVDLEGQWEVGLVEIQYPHCWYNIPEKQTCTIGVAETGLVHSFIVHEGYYPDVVSLLSHIKSQAAFAADIETDRLRLYHNKVTKLVSVKCTDCELRLTPLVQRLLGLDTTYITEKVRGTLIYDMSLLSSLYVYCDLLEPRVVGDMMTQLLRIIPVEGEDGDTVTRIYENVHYVPLQRKSFQSIEIDIRDTAGKLVPFERGTLIVTLHFRRRRALQ